MPAQTKNGGVASKAGRSTLQRSKGHAPLRVNRVQRSYAAPRELGGFRTVTFKPRAGYSVYDRLKVKWVNDSTLQQIYNDLYACYNRYFILKHGRPSPIKHIKIWEQYESALDKLIFSFKELCAPHEFNIERNESGIFYFTIYAACSFPEQWHVFQVWPTIKKLRRKSKGLHDLFLKFLNTFRLVGTEMWFNGYTAELLQWQIKENIECGYYEDNKPLERQMKAVVEAYTNGKPAKYAKLICQPEKSTPEQLLVELKKYRSCPEIIELIREGCAFLSLGKDMGDFCYDPFMGNDEYFGHGLGFEFQASVVWDISDVATSEYEEFIDTQALEGLYAPYAHLNVTPDCEEVFVASQWPHELAKFMNLAAHLTQKFTQK